MPSHTAVTELVKRAQQRFGTLTAAEKKMFEAAELGNWAQCAEKGDDTDPANAASWSDSRLIRARCIAWMCTDPEASARVSHQGIDVSTARIQGSLNLSFANVQFPLLFSKCAFTGKINLQSAHLKAINLPGTCALSIAADGIKVDGSVFLRNGFTADGEVRLVGATLGGNLECDGGTISNDGAIALNAAGMKVNGYIFLRDGFKADGEVRLLGATVGGNLECVKGTFDNAKGNALCADNLHVKGSVFLCDGFQAKGHLRFVGASVDRYFIWKNVTSPQDTRLDLESTRIGTFVDDAASWPSRGNLNLHGLVYDRFGSESRVSVNDRIRWLQLQSSPASESPQPYEQLAKVLRDSGDEDGAKEVQIEKNRKRMRRMSYLKRPFYWLFGVTTGYGYRPERALGFGLAVVILGALLYWQGFNNGAMDLTKGVNDYHPTSQPIVYSIETFVPLVKLRHAEYWLPAYGKGGAFLSCRYLPTLGTILCFYLWFETFAGWILTTLFLAGLTGLIRK